MVPVLPTTAAAALRATRATAVATAAELTARRVRVITTVGIDDRRLDVSEGAGASRLPCRRRVLVTLARGRAGRRCCDLGHSRSSVHGHHRWRACGPLVLHLSGRVEGP